MDYRHEWKYVISYADKMILRQRLQAVMRLDENAVDGNYLIRSLYFDTPSDMALKEKLNGVSRREKFRMRYYNQNTECIHLEKKSKLAGLGKKQSVNLTPDEVQKIINGEIEWMLHTEYELLHELYAKMRMQQLRPKTIVDYTREPFVYAPGNVRVTLDYNIRTGIRCTDFLNPDCPMIPTGDDSVILEVKWDAYLPDVIRSAVQLESRHVTAFSKYAQCRIYG